MSIFEERYRQRTPRSKAIYEDARNHLAGGVGGRAKFIKPYPLYLRSAKGCRVIDVDGNEYIDVTMGAGPCVLGHNPEPVREAVRRQMSIATHTLWATELEVELAKRIKRHMPHLELLRFTNSGSEATRTAVRVARAFTGKEKIAKFEGNFHGADDAFLISTSAAEVAGSDAAPQPVFDCPGVPSALLGQTLVLPYNDAATSEALLRRHARELAAVIMELVAVTPGFGVPADKKFLETIRRVTAEEGIVLIFDEIVTGFRLALGGAAALFGVSPDLAAIGKAFAGGIPVGAFGGRRDIMEKVVTPTGEASDARTKIFHSGTFTANPVAMAAGLATLDELEKGDVYAHLNDLGDYLRKGFTDLFARRGIAAQVTGIGSIYNFVFSEHPIRNRRDVLRSDLTFHGELCLGLITKGILQPIRHTGFLSAAHTRAEMDQILTAAEEVLQEMRA
jgi:glutamate-1-semialdehyde 2,1-aminomutase